MGRKLVIFFTLILFVISIHLGTVPAGALVPESELAKGYLLLTVHFNPQVVTRVPTSQKVVALTFDDGPDPRFTPKVLDILKEHNIKATFFVVGEDAGLYPELVKRAVQEGHEIENHTYTHPDLLQANDLTVSEELLWCQEKVEELTGRTPLYFRPPRKLFNADILKLCQDYGYKMILWTVCLENKKATSPAEMAERVVKKCRSGAIILAHDGRLDRSFTVQALPLLIEQLHREGYRFVTLEDLLTKYSQDSPAS